MRSSIVSLSEESLSTSLLYMKKKIEELTNQNKNTKIFLYMVIHDLKHPNEALIDNVNRVVQQLYFT